MNGGTTVQLVRQLIKFREALKEISEVKGRYSEDELEWASNTIEDMRAIALRALGEER